MINVNMLCSALIRTEDGVGMTQVKYITEYLISNVYRNIVLVIGKRSIGGNSQYPVLSGCFVLTQSDPCQLQLGVGRMEETENDVSNVGPHVTTSSQTQIDC